MRIFIGLALLAAPAAIAAQARTAAGPGPSFDCAAAATPVERMICADPTLRALDLGIAAFYRSARRSARPRAQSRAQVRWLRDERSLCVASSCLREAMAERLWTLSRAAGPDLAAYRNQDGDSHLVVAPLGRGWYAFGATGYWHGPTINSAGAAGAFRLDADRGEVAALSADDCRFTLTRLDADRWRIIGHPSESGMPCGGMNATVEGTYRRAR